ncbi:hypothetical protein RHOSPDRAFT_33570 [Rhodotorula sp. JG-1b]|nr:hypothetical protein RHOSPDRAFT_33570 [Rhodotorula sp. JG-1b]
MEATRLARFFPRLQTLSKRSNPGQVMLTRRAATIAAAVAAPLVDHYNTTRKNRTKGAGFHQCGGNEDERQAQMDALAKEQEETERKRMETAELGDAVKRKRE